MLLPGSETLYLLGKENSTGSVSDRVLSSSTGSVSDRVLAIAKTRSLTLSVLYRLILNRVLAIARTRSLPLAVLFIRPEFI